MNAVLRRLGRAGATRAKLASVLGTLLNLGPLDWLSALAH